MMRNLLAHAGRQGRAMVAGFIRTAFAQEGAASADATAPRRHVADQLRHKTAKLATMMVEMETDVLVYMGFPKEHRDLVVRNTYAASKFPCIRLPLGRRRGAISVH